MWWQSSSCARSTGRLELARREFVPDDLTGVRLAIVATGRRSVNRWIATLCDARAIPVNVVDDREASRVIVPAIIDRDPMLIAISSGGASPVLARRWRERLEALIPSRIGELALWLRGLRGATRRRLREPGERRRYFETLIDGPAARRFIDGDAQGAERLAQRLLGSSAARPQAARTRGAGRRRARGSRAPDLEGSARPVGRRRDLARPTGVGRRARPRAPRRRQNLRGQDRRAAAARPRNASTRWLIEHARAGRRVVRLKGGDPFIFGRGGEELEALAARRHRFSGGSRHYRGGRAAPRMPAFR